MEMKPLYDKILIQEDPDVEEQLASGLVVPTSENANTPKKGTVLAVGNGRPLPDGTLMDLTVVEGDRVLFSGRSGFEIDELKSDFKYRLVREEEILAILP